MRTRNALAVAVVGLAACGAPRVGAGSITPAPTTWTTGTWSTVCDYDTDAIAELSGLAPSQRHKGVLWALNDSGNSPVLYALDASDCRIRGRHTLSSTNTDWEALASGRNAEGRPVLWVGDIGDNIAARRDVRILEVREPDLGVTSGSARAHPFTYPGGPRDAEALMASPDGTHVFVIAKSAAGPMYRIPVRNTMVKARKVARTSPFATDAALGRHGYAIRDYAAITRYRSPVPGARLGRSNPPLLRQSEAVAFSRSGAWLYTASEGDSRLLRARVVQR